MAHFRRLFGPSKTEIWRPDEGGLGSSFPDTVDQLHFSAVGVMEDVGRLKLLYVFAETLEQSCRIGSACEAAIGVTV
jgi:hypothetical protein